MKRKRDSDRTHSGGLFFGGLMHWLNVLGPVLGLVGVYVLFVFIAAESFSRASTLEGIARHTVVVGTAALGMTLVIILGGIDLSVGSLVALGAVVVAWLLQEAGVSPMVAVVGGVAVGALFGMINGVLITKLRVVPFIVTLGMMLLVRGAAKGIAKEQKIDVDSEKLGWLKEFLQMVPPEQSWMLVPSSVWLMGIMAVVMAGVLRYTRFGRHVFAIGSNEDTARLCGVAVDRVKILVYTLIGGFAGLAGVMQFSLLRVGDPTTAMALELDVIAAVVIGGGSLAGGAGSVLGTLAGAFIITVIGDGCSQMGMDNWIQEIVTGAIIGLAVALDRLRHRAGS